MNLCDVQPFARDCRSSRRWGPVSLTAILRVLLRRISPNVSTFRMIYHTSLAVRLRTDDTGRGSLRDRAGCGKTERNRRDASGRRNGVARHHVLPLVTRHPPLVFRHYSTVSPKHTVCDAQFFLAFHDFLPETACVDGVAGCGPEARHVLPPERIECCHR